MIVTSAESAAKRLGVMRKGVTAAALTIDNKFRAEYGEPEYRSADRSALAKMRNPYTRTSPYRVAMLTFTYAQDAEWSPRDIAEVLAHYRKWFKRRKAVFHYVWTVELQGNGKPHYHVICWLPRGLTPPFADEQGWWPHGMSNAKFTYSPVGYVAKYASKTEGKSGQHLPKRCRLWGHGGLSLAERAPIAYATAPRWLKNVVHHESHPRRRTVDTKSYRTATGEILAFGRRVAAWVCSAGESKGWAFLGPYRFEDFTRDGMVLSHSGIIEAICPEGESHFISCKG